MCVSPGARSPGTALGLGTFGHWTGEGCKGTRIRGLLSGVLDSRFFIPLRHLRRWRLGIKRRLLSTPEEAHAPRAHVRKANLQRRPGAVVYSCTEVERIALLVDQCFAVTSRFLGEIVKSRDFTWRRMAARCLLSGGGGPGSDGGSLPAAARRRAFLHLPRCPAPPHSRRRRRRRWNLAEDSKRGRRRRRARRRHLQRRRRLGEATKQVRSSRQEPSRQEGRGERRPP